MDKNVDKKAIAGVSLVEIMISLLLVAIALIAITTVFPNMAKHRKGIHEAEQAKMIAAEVLEGLQLYSDYTGYTCIGFNNTSCTGVTAATSFCTKYKGKKLNVGAAEYEVTWTTSCATGANAVSTATVEVKWRKSGKDHKVKMTGALR